MTYDDGDLDTLAKTLYGEARGEPPGGKTAVAWVIRNRAERQRFAGARAGQPGAVAAVCRAPWQFSCWNAGDPNRPLLEVLDRARDAAERSVASRVLGGLDADPTRGADHYHTIARPVWAAAWPPDWAPQMKEVARFGGHVFYDSRSRP